MALIANPHASRFSGRQRDRVVAALAAGHKVEVLQTGHPGQATELAAEAVAGGAEVVAVLGGDGTVNEVVNGLRDADAALGLLGGGRVNVLARGLGLPADPDRAAARLVELLAAGRPAPPDPRGGRRPLLRPQRRPRASAGRSSARSSAASGPSSSTATGRTWPPASRPCWSTTTATIPT